MMDLGYEPSVSAGDSFALCLKVPDCPNTGTGRNEMAGPTGSTGRFFKYYIRPRLGTEDCGWYARADYDVYMWVVLRVNFSWPPVILDATQLHHTVSTLPRHVYMVAYACYRPPFGDQENISQGFLTFRVNEGQWDSIALSFNGSVWEGQIPGEPIGSSVDYYYVAIDSSGLRSATQPGRYWVVDLNRSGYETTFPAGDFIDITSTGTMIPAASFFPPSSGEDDGTAGPFNLPAEFVLFGHTRTHAWIGANGAIALSNSPIDTIDVNSAGFFASWDIPSSAVPRNFLGPFWNDLCLAPRGHGAVYYQDTSSRFIVEYYRVGNFNSPSDTTTTFEIVLDRSDSTITFQYADVGTSGLDFWALVGLQSDAPQHGWLFLNRWGYPDTTRPRNNLAIKMKYVGITDVSDTKETPTSFALYPNYPNPFNPITVIRYSLPVGQDGTLSYHVSLRIYDLLGQEVATLVNEVKQLGTYTVTWDADGVSSGVYFYRMQAGKFVDTKKLVLVK